MLPHLDVNADEPTAPEEPEKAHDTPHAWRVWAYPVLRAGALLACGFLVGRITAPSPVPPAQGTLAARQARSDATPLEKVASGAEAPVATEQAPEQPGRIVEGVVVDEAGNPVVAAAISIAGSPPRSSGEAPGAAAETPAGELGTTAGPVPAIPGGQTPGAVLGPTLAMSDGLGKFSLRGVAADTLQVIASAPGFAPSARTLEANPAPVRITLRKAGTVDGAAQDEKGNALESVLIVGRTEDGLTVTAMSDAEGDFVLKNVRGKLQVQAFADAHVPASCDVVVEANAQMRCDFTLARSVPQAETGGRVAGYVLDSLGMPVVGASVWTDEKDASAVTDERGEFVLLNVAPGALSVLAEEKSAGTGQSAVVRAREGETLNDVRIYLPRRFTRTETGTGTGTAAATPTPKPKPHTTSNVDNQLALELRAGKVMIALLAAAASDSGLQVGDVLETIDGERVLSLGQARGMLRDPPGEPAKIRVLRGRQRTTVRYRRPKL